MKPHHPRRENLAKLIAERYAGKKGRLADAMGKKRPMIYRLFSDGPSARDIGEELAREIERFHDLPTNWLDRTHGARENLGDVLAGVGGPVPPPGSRLPMRSWADAGRERGARHPFHLLQGAPCVAFDSDASDLAFCLKVEGDAMVRPDGSGFPPGCVIAVEPTRRPRHGDYVIVRFPDVDNAMFAQYLVHGPRTLLKPLNADYPTLPFAVGARVVGVVFEKRVAERF